jgi:rRNA maturation RNase YbeY
MIEFSSQNDFNLKSETAIATWISSIIVSEEFVEGDISYVFCDDSYLLEINKEFLNHDTLTDIVSFDYSLGKEIHGEIFISVERVAENADTFKTGFDNELHRVMIHGILHYCGYTDKTVADKKLMRTKEDEALKERLFI